MFDSNVTRRRFMTRFAGTGLGATLLPGVLWARMQEAGAREVTAEMLSDALAVSGLEFGEEERERMLESVNDRVSDYQELHELKIPNDISPPFHFNPLVPGMQVDKSASPFRMSALPRIERPSNLEDVAFWTVRELGELVRSRQVTSVELTEMYLQRLERYNPLLNCVVTLTDELAMAQARQADREIAAGRYRGPLHGIPWGAKDIIAVQGYKTTWGSRRIRTRSSIWTRRSSTCCARRVRCWSPS